MILGNFMTFGGVGGSRHWRIYTTASNSSISQVVAEVQFREEIGGPNMAVGGVASADSSTVGNGPENAFDGDSSTTWVHTSPVTPNWIAYEFPSALNIKQIALQATTTSVNAANRMPMDFRVEKSSDGVTWEVVSSFTGQTGWTLGEIRVFTL